MASAGTSRAPAARERPGMKTPQHQSPQGYQDDEATSTTMLKRRLREGAEFTRFLRSREDRA
jgi:hypothetical protein